VRQRLIRLSGTTALSGLAAFLVLAVWRGASEPVNPHDRLGHLAMDPRGLQGYLIDPAPALPLPLCSTSDIIPLVIRHDLPPGTGAYFGSGFDLADVDDPALTHRGPYRPMSAGFLPKPRR
jgi:hypothetical protein